MARRLVLASASPARRFLLESAGLAPEVEISRVEEDGTERLGAVEAVELLARRKAEAVAARLAGTWDKGSAAPLIVACDSLLDFDGEAWGKAGSPEEVIDRWRRMRGRTGLLHTGHVVLDPAAGRFEAETDTAVVHFGAPSDAEIEAYSKTAEALEVAGPFTLEGRSAPWVESIEGNYGTITGISLPVLRRLLAHLGVELIDLWS